MPKQHTSHKKRYGKHHRHSKRYARVYAPYLPLIIAIVASLLISVVQPVKGRVLPYATEMSVGSLISATNSHRAANGLGKLAVSSALNSAAQAKANHMVANDYWSHNTPDGQPPWVFIDNTGYDYTKAGENLAYGFVTSNDTVQGWMNSPSHKANMLDSAFSQAGFGFANGANYNGSGEQTVVVAFYASPQVAAASSPEPAPDPAQTQPAQSEPTPEPESGSAKPNQSKQNNSPKQPEQKKDDEPNKDPAPVTNTSSDGGASPQSVNRTSLIGASWILGAITAVLGGLVAFKLLHLGVKLHRFLRHHPKLRHALQNGQRLVLHHPLLDSTILGLTILGYTLSRVVGVIL